MELGDVMSGMASTVIELKYCRGCLFLNWLQAVKCVRRSGAHFTVCSQFRNKHPLPNDREVEVHVLQCVC